MKKSDQSQFVGGEEGSGRNSGPFSQQPMKYLHEKSDQSQFLGGEEGSGRNSGPKSI
jgi:hypothetical protein